MTTATPTRSPWRIFGLLAGAVALTTLNFSVVFVAFGEISESLDASGSTVSWALTAFSITTAALLVPGGWLADRFGRTRIFLIGFALFVFGSFLVSVAPDAEFLIVARVLQAAGLALESPASLALVLDAFPASRRATAVGAMGMAGGIAAALGPMIGGALVGWLGWRWTFFLNVPAGVLVFLLIAPRLPPDRPATGRGAPDLAGVALLMVGVSSLALAIVQSDDWGFADPRTVSSAVIASVLLTVLVLRSASHPEPILYLPLFREHDFRLGSALSFLYAGSFAGTFLALVQFLIDGWGLTLLQAGVAVGLVPAIGGPMSVVAGRIADRHGQRSVILPGSLLMATGGSWMWLAVSAERDIVGLWLPAVGVYAFGIGFGHAACQSAALSRVAQDRLGIGGAMNRIFMEIGGTISVAVVIALLARHADPVDALRGAMVFLVAVSLLSAPLAAGLRNRGGSLEPLGDA